MMPGIPANSDVEDQYDYLRTPVVSLKEGLAVQELLSKHKTEFEIKPDDAEEDNHGTAAESCFDFDDIEKVVNLDMIDVEDGDEGTPFDRYRSKMTDIRDDGKLKKFVVKQGVGPLVPVNAVVYVRYQAYMEYSEVPFDSTLWQCSGEGDLPIPYNLAKHQLLTGLHLAILTMRKGEKAEILVHPDLAYGRFGCPPRIPPEATIMFIVEIDRFVDCGDVPDNDDLDYSERKEYRNVFKVAKNQHLLANDFFSRENYNAAANKYRLVINMIHNARLANSEEEKERNHFLIKIYTNACICYKKMKNIKRICILAADAIRVDEAEVLSNFKLLYLWGWAKMMLGDYTGAKTHLRKAQSLQPRDRDISAALIELERRKNDALQQERIMMRRAFGNNPASSEVKITEVDEEEEKFRETVRQELELFAEDKERSQMSIKDHNFSSAEEKIYLQVAKAIGLYARVVDGEKRIILITKPTDY